MRADLERPAPQARRRSASRASAAAPPGRGRRPHAGDGLVTYRRRRTRSARRRSSSAGRAVMTMIGTRTRARMSSQMRKPLAPGSIGRAGRRPGRRHRRAPRRAGRPRTPSITAPALEVELSATRGAFVVFDDQRQRRSTRTVRIGGRRAGTGPLCSVSTKAAVSSDRCVADWAAAWPAVGMWR